MEKILLILNKRDRYRRRRKSQLEKVATLKDDIVEDDLGLFEEFKILRDRANRMGD